MKKLTAYVSGSVQKVGYRARVVQMANGMGLKGFIENLKDGRVRIVAEGEDEKLKIFENAIDIKNSLIQVTSIEKEYSQWSGEFSAFSKLVYHGETDSRLDEGISILKDMKGLLVSLNDSNKDISRKIDQMNDNLSGKIDQMNDNLSGKMDIMIDLQEETLDGQGKLLSEVHESRKDFKDYLDRRFEKLESEVYEMRSALKAKGII